MQKVPRVVSSPKQIQNPEANASQISQLRAEMKSFMKDIKTEFSHMVQNYEAQISQLKQESQMLKRSQSTIRTASSPFKPTQSIILKRQQPNGFMQSEILPVNSKQFHRSANSPFYPQPKTQPFSTWTSAFQVRNISPLRNTNHFPQQLIDQESQHQRTFQRSRYQRHSQNKRQHEEELVHYLQSHRKNLEQSTHKMMGLLGKQQKEMSDSVEEEQHQDNDQMHERSAEDTHNKSLSQICDSLDHSFVSQRARKSRLKQKKAEEQAKKKRLQEQAKNQKIRKERALKNLLQRLRQNANSTNAPQIVKASKLIPAGPKALVMFQPQSSLPARKNSKVMINPVPLNSVSNMNLDPSPKLRQKRPASILKQSSNILTRSISGISAISFQE